MDSTQGPYSRRPGHNFSRQPQNPRSYQQGAHQHAGQQMNGQGGFRPQGVAYPQQSFGQPNPTAGGFWPNNSAGMQGPPQYVPTLQYAPNQFVAPWQVPHAVPGFGGVPMATNAMPPPQAQTYVQPQAPRTFVPQQQHGTPAWPQQAPLNQQSSAPRTANPPRFVVPVFVPQAQETQPRREHPSASIVNRWQTMATQGTVRGPLNADTLKQIGSTNVLNAIKQAATKADGSAELSGVCTLANAYLDVLHAQSSMGNGPGNRGNAAQTATLAALANGLRDALRVALDSHGNAPTGRDVPLRLLRLVADAPNSLSQWLHAAGQSSFVRTTATDDGRRMRVPVGNGALLLNVRRDTPYEDVDVGRLVALLALDVNDEDAHNIARWLGTHAEGAFATNPEQAHEALRLAFNLCPSLDPGSIKQSSTQGRDFEQFMNDAWSVCRQALLDLASEQAPAPDHIWAKDVPNRAVFWSVVAQLCERAEPAWQTVLATLLERVPMYIDALPENERPLLANLLTKLPVRAATEMQVAALTTWYADNLLNSATDAATLAATKQFLQNVVADTAQSRREPLYGMIEPYTKKSDNTVVMEALLDLFPAHDRFMGMPTTLAAKLLMHVDEKYLRAHAEKFQTIQQVILNGESPYADLCHKDAAPRWRTILSIESLQPSAASIVQREYAEMRPATSIANLLQEAIARGKDVEVGRKLEQIAEELPADSSLYIRLNMALAERARAFSVDATSSKKAPKARSLMKTPVRPKQAPKTLERSLVRLEAVLARSTCEQDAQTGTLEPLPMDFLLQEMRALQGVDMSAAQQTADKVSTQTLRHFGSMLSTHIDQTFRELLTLTEVLHRRADFDAARPLMQALLQHVIQGDTALEVKEASAIETTLRAWTAEAPRDLQDLVRTFGAMDFAQSLRALHTPAEKKQTSEERTKVQQERLRALDKITQALADTSPQENQNRLRQIAHALPQILNTMGTRNEREALGAFWPAELSKLAPTAFDTKALSLAYASIANSNDAARPQVKRLLDRVSSVLTRGLADSTASSVDATHEALIQVVDEGGWTRAFKILLLNPKALAADLPAIVALQMLKGAPVKVLRDHNAAVSLLTKRLLESSEPLAATQDSTQATRQDPWSEADRLALLQEHLDALPFLRLLDRAGVGSDNPAAQATLRAAVSGKQWDVLHALTDASSEHVLSRQSGLYWGVRDALMAITQDPTALLQQLAEALDAPATDTPDARSLAFLRAVLRHPVSRLTTALDANAIAVLNKHLPSWYATLRSLDPATRLPETAAIANLWRLRGDFTGSGSLVEELLTQGQDDSVKMLFETGDESLLNAAASVCKGSVRTLPTDTATPLRAVGTAPNDNHSAIAHVALQAAVWALRDTGKTLTSESQRKHDAFVNDFAGALAESSLLLHVTPNDRAVLAEVVGLLRESNLSAPQAVALTRRMTRIWVDVTRNTDAGKQLAGNMQEFLLDMLGSDAPDVAGRSRAAVRSAISDCLQDGQGSKAWRLLALLPNCDGMPASALHELLLKSHLCAPQDARTNIAKVLSALPSDSSIPGLMDESTGDKGAWSTLLKIPLAVSWLLEHMQHAFVTTDSVPQSLIAKWQGAVARLPESERESVLSKGIATTSPANPLYLVLSLARIESLEGVALLDHAVNVLKAFERLGDKRAAQQDDALRSFLHKALASLSQSDFSNEPRATGAQSQFFKDVHALLAPLPLSTKKKTLEDLARLTIAFGDWINAASVIGELLQERQEIIALGGPEKRPTAWRLAEYLLHVGGQGLHETGELKAYYDAIAELLRAIPEAALSSTIAAEFYTTAARLVTYGSSEADVRKAASLLDRIRKARQSIGDVAAIASQWKTSEFEIFKIDASPYDFMEMPAALLSLEEQARAALWAPALALDFFRVLSSDSTDDVLEDSDIEVSEAFTYMMHHPNGANILLDAMTETFPLFVGDGNLLHVDPEGYMPIMMGEVPVLVVEDTAVRDHVANQAAIFADVFSAFADRKSSRPQHPFAQSRLFDLRASRQESSSNDKLLDAFIDVAAHMLKTPDGLTLGMAYLVTRAEMWQSCTAEQRMKLQQALLSAQSTPTPYGQQIDLLLGVATSGSNNLPDDATWNSFFSHLDQVAELVFSTAIQQSMAEKELRSWLQLVVHGLYINGSFSQDDSHLRIWRDLAKRIMGQFAWGPHSHYKEQVQLRIDNAHAFSHTQALNIALQTIANTPFPHTVRGQTAMGLDVVEDTRPNNLFEQNAAPHTQTERLDPAELARELGITLPAASAQDHQLPTAGPTNMYAADEASTPYVVDDDARSDRSSVFASHGSASDSDSDSDSDDEHTVRGASDDEAS